MWIPKGAAFIWGPARIRGNTVFGIRKNFDVRVYTHFYVYKKFLLHGIDQIYIFQNCSTRKNLNVWRFVRKSTDAIETKK